MTTSRKRVAVFDYDGVLTEDLGDYLARWHSDIGHGIIVVTGRSGPRLDAASADIRARLDCEIYGNSLGDPIEHKARIAADLATSGDIRIVAWYDDDPAACLAIYCAGCPASLVRGDTITPITGARMCLAMESASIDGDRTRRPVA